MRGKRDNIKTYSECWLKAKVYLFCLWYFSWLTQEFNVGVCYNSFRMV